MPKFRLPAEDLLLLLLLATLWGASYTFIRVGVRTIPPLTLMAARTCIAGALLLAWNSANKTPLPRDRLFWKQCVVQALLNSVIPFTLIAWAEQWVGAGLATILNSTSPILVLVASHFLLAEKSFNRRKLIGVICGLAGICLVVGTSSLVSLGAQLLPQLAIVAATICYAGAALYGRSFRNVPASLPAAGSLLAGASMLVPISAAFDRPWEVHPSTESIVALLALSLFSTAIAFVIYFRLVKSIGAVNTTTQAYLRVPIGVALGVLFLGESLAPTVWVGLACVIAGVAAITLPEKADAQR